jgi:hypothetical protein
MNNLWVVLSVPRGSELPIPRLHRLTRVRIIFHLSSIVLHKLPHDQKKKHAKKGMENPTRQLLPPHPSRLAPVRDLAGVDHAGSTVASLR